MRRHLTLALATTMLLAGAAPAVQADDFKSATGKSRTAISKIAKKRGFTDIYAVLVAKELNGNTRFAVACGNGPGLKGFSAAKRRRGGYWRAHRPFSSGALQTYDAACFARRSGAAAANQCTNLRAGIRVKRALYRSHARRTPGRFTGPRRGSVYYGRCGSTHYALASFKTRLTGYTDQPERFRRRAHHRWRDQGDTGDGVCRAAPQALLHLWRLACSQ